MASSPCLFCGAPVPAHLVCLGADDFAYEADSHYSEACADADAWRHAVNLDAARRAGLSVAEACARFGWAPPEVLP